MGNIKLTHANASVASPLYLDSNLRDSNEQTVTFRKRPFETGPTNGLVSLPSMLFTYAHPLQGRPYRVQR